MKTWTVRIPTTGTGWSLDIVLRTQADTRVGAVEKVSNLLQRLLDEANGVERRTSDDVILD